MIVAAVGPTGVTISGGLGRDGRVFGKPASLPRSYSLLLRNALL